MLSNQVLVPESWAGGLFAITPLTLGLLVVAFGALGLFPTYFALTQDISSKHQGKISGTLGFCAHLSLSAIYPVEGWIIDSTGSYEPILGAIGVLPLAAFVALLIAWPAPPVPANAAEPPSSP